ncbi:hypothetical protein B9G98_02930 [Wickerhamiella sorbophila]|uniref:Cytochrome P450 52A13 n=1 Tax=Wickerhamiella sorbophila TaxID=45607 RepID=A0A2T0FK00_9ASCO|nr:hypothetical protein B9G98_02930 [Wickerhamiella sorbophila]PRT55310.1 hypothetical protein B9G98_02930 [Wickerhamiella sorbophila]
MIGIVLLLALVVAMIYDYIYPRYLYPYRARKLGAEPPTEHLSWPFGIPAGFGFLKEARQLRQMETSLEFSHGPTKTVVSQAFGSHIIVTRDPEVIKAMLSTQFADFGLANRYKVLYPLLGDGIFTSDGPHWKSSRTLLRPLFMRERVSNLKMMEHHVQSLFKVIDGWNGQPGNVQTQFRLLTRDTALHFLFGVDMDSLAGVEQYFEIRGGEKISGTELTDAIRVAAGWLGVRAKLMQLYWLASPPQMWKAVKICHAFVDKVIETAKTKDKLEDDAEYSFVADLCQYTSDSKLIRDQAFSIFVAGFGTTSSLMSHLCMHLAATKRWKKLREHVLHDIGTDPSAVTFETLKSCKYLQWCINESLRMHPNVPLNLRRARRDIVLPTGGGVDGKSPLFIPKGRDIVYHVLALHHDFDIWGKDADEYIPERWDNLKVPSWCYIPFNGGPRVCLGQQFALTEAAYVLCRLVQEYDDLIGPGYDAYKFRFSLTIAIEPGVTVKFVRS